MNDFTKDELKQLYIMACSYTGNVHNQTMSNSLLMTKIQTLIDNYSETHCTNHELVRLKLLSGKEYDFCETCFHVNRMR